MNLLAVLVTYNCKIEEAKTLTSLLRNYKNNPIAFKNFRLIIYDNSLFEQVINLTVPFDYEYVHDQNNKGLSFAYNYALNEAIKYNHNWLLLLDQDSCLSDEFFNTLADVIFNNEENETLCAIVPKVRYQNTFFSPSKVFWGGTHRPINMRHHGICNFRVCAVGSGSVVRVSLLKHIGGFNEMFWLDCLDRWLFLKINEFGGKIYVSDSVLDHDLSVMDYDKYMTQERYNNILIYETLFMKSFKSRAEYFFYCIRLLKRTAYLLIIARNKNYSLMTLRHLVANMNPSLK